MSTLSLRVAPAVVILNKFGGDVWNGCDDWNAKTESVQSIKSGDRRGDYLRLFPLLMLTLLVNIDVLSDVSKGRKDSRFETHDYG